MRTRPDGAELLHTAHKVLREKLLPQLPASCKHDALMVANAMSIAMRQLQQGEAPAQRELESLRHLLGDTISGDSVRAALLLGNQVLARRLRRGEGDPDQPRRMELLAHLRRTVRQQLQESKPGYLK